MSEAVTVMPCGTKLTTDAMQMMIRAAEWKAGAKAMGIDASAPSDTETRASQ